MFDCTAQTMLDVLMVLKDLVPLVEGPVSGGAAYGLVPTNVTWK